MPTAFDSSRTWVFALTADELWDRMSQVQDYRTWWPWLRPFEPGPGLVDGAAWRCEVEPPLPYVVRFVVHIDEIRRAESADVVDPSSLDSSVLDPSVVHATVSGDIRGTARLTLTPDGDGTRATLVSRLAPSHPLLRGFGRVARPLVERGHDWVLDQGQQQFIERGLGDPGR